MLKLYKLYGCCILECLPDELKNDKRFIFTIFKTEINGYAQPYIIQYASEILKDDYNFIKDIVGIDSSRTIQFIPEKYKDNERIMYKAITENPFNFSYASERLKDDENFILKICNTNIEVLWYVSSEKRNNKEFIMKLIQKNYNALKYASERLKDDENLVMMAIKNNSYAINYASFNLQKKRKIFLFAQKRITFTRDSNKNQEVYVDYKQFRYKLNSFFYICKFL